MSGSQTREAVLEDLRTVATQKRRLVKSDATLTGGTSGQRSKIAEWDIDAPIVLREAGDIRLALTVVEQFQGDGNAGNTETYNLSADLIQTPNTEDLVIFEGGTRAQPASVDYAANSFDYQAGANNYVHAAYVAGDPGQITLEKEAPRSKGGISEIVFDAPAALIHRRDQNDQPPRFSFNVPEAKVVPRKWTLALYADIAAYDVEWDDSNTANSQGATAVNAIASFPTKVGSRDVPGLADTVKRHIIR